MAHMKLSELSEKMRKIDFAMLSTRTENNAVASRPMSNNGEVEYEGTSFFFALENTRTVSDIGRESNVGLSFSGSKGLLGKPPLFVAVEGKAELLRDKASFAQHWTKDLDFWFKDGIDTPGLLLIRVEAERIHYWDGEDEGEIIL